MSSGTSPTVDATRKCFLWKKCCVISSSKNWIWVLSERAIKNQRKLPKSVVRRIHDGLNQIAASEDPLARLIPLSGEWRGYYKVRFGPYRVRIEADTDNQRLIVHKIGPRQNFYD
ncbi:MAG: type II toxin-antitoxin system RelE/ParE family toxin [Microbacteriaceae bacterium]|nr:type II toxin-antitoxin system RelE/ParE family toxin [Microbacteriaceae bacterium]